MSRLRWPKYCFTISDQTVQRVWRGMPKGAFRQEVLKLSKFAFVLAAALTALPALAHAAEKGACVDVSVPKQAVAAEKGQWIELTQSQWQFVRGIYAMNPLTPPGLPYGDRAALAKVEGNEDGLIFFIDGDRACTPMAAPQALLGLMEDVAKAKIKHVGQGL